MQSIIKNSAIAAQLPEVDYLLIVLITIRLHNFRFSYATIASILLAKSFMV